MRKKKPSIFRIRRYMTLTLLLFTAYSLLGQNMAAIDSMLSVVDLQTDTIKVKTLNELAWEYRRTSPKKAEDYALLGMRMSDSLNYLDGRLTSLNRLGSISFNSGDLNKAEKLYLKVLEEERDRDYTYGVGRALNQLGLIHMEKGQYESALEYFLEAEDKFESIERLSIVATTSNNIGDLYRKLGDYEKAMQHLLKSLDLKQTSGYKRATALTLQNIGIFQIELDNYESAIEYLSQSKDIFTDLKDDYELARTQKNIGVAYFEAGDHISAEKVFLNYLGLKKTIGQADRDPDLYNNLGSIYFKKAEYDKAHIYYQTGIEIEPSCDLHINLGHVGLQKGNYRDAIANYGKALAIAKHTGERFQEMSALYHLSDAHSKVKDYASAMRYNRAYLEVRDDLENSYKSAMNYKMDHEQEQKRIALLEKEKELTQEKLQRQEAENKRKSMMIYGLIIGSLLLTLLFFALNRADQQRQRARMAEKDRQIQQQKVDELLRRQEVDSMNAMMLGQEEERKRIARDLHDRLGSMLAMVKNHFKSVEEDIDSLKDSNTMLYRKANHLLDEACEEVRKISQDMASGVLTKFGLIAALEDLVNTLEGSKQLRVEFVHHGLQGRLPLDLEIAVYRIIQELVSNVLKHAEAKEVSIQLLKGKDGLNVIVEDDGVGFEASGDHTGMGLKNIGSRLQVFHGKLNIDSRVNTGTTVSVDIPLDIKDTL